MPADQLNTGALMEMANEFSGGKIDPKYFPDMLDSPLIIESLRFIYILHKNKKLSSGDEQEIKRVFQDYFSFFAKQDNKKCLILTFVFFCLMLFSGVGCIYLPLVFGPFFSIFTMGLIIATCFTNIHTHPIQVTSVHDNFKHELFSLKYNLNNLKNFLVNKYPMNAGHDFLDCMDASLDRNVVEQPKNKKKTVSFAPKLCTFFYENYEVRSRANSYESRYRLK